MFSETKFTSGLHGIKGSSHGRLAFGHNYSSNRASYGVGGFITNLEHLTFTRSNAYAFGGLFGVSFTGTEIKQGPGKTSDTCWIKTYISGTVNRYTGNGVVAALWAQDNIKSANILAGYFDGKVGIGTLMF